MPMPTYFPDDLEAVADALDAAVRALSQSFADTLPADAETDRRCRSERTQLLLVRLSP